MTTTNFKPVQNQPTSLGGGGAVAGATTLILSSLTQIDGTTLTMTDFGTKGFGTIEPGNSTYEEQISFTGITQNANGTATLTGVKTVLDISPYTETSGLAQSHAGAVTFVISNTAGFYDQMLAKGNDATITGLYTFPNGASTPVLGASYVAPTLDTQVASKKYIDDISILGATNATTTTQGLVELGIQSEIDAGTAIGGTGASIVATPATTRSRLLADYIADTGSANAYNIAPSPTFTALVAGNRVTFKVKTTNTAASTIVVNALSGTAIFRNDGSKTALSSGDLVAGQFVELEYNGVDGFVLLSQPTVPVGSMQMYAGATAPSGWLLCDASSVLRTDYPSLFAVISTTYGSADGTHFNMPDMRGRVPVGVGTGTGGASSGTGLPAGGSALTAVARAGWKGEETHVLTIAEMPAHTHPGTYVGNGAAGGSTGPVYGDSNTSGAGFVISQGSDTAHNTIQPVMGVNFIIKT